MPWVSDGAGNLIPGAYELFPGLNPDVAGTPTAVHAQVAGTVIQSGQASLTIQQQFLLLS